MSGVHERRVDQEWRLLIHLAAANPGIVDIHGRRTEADSDVFVIALHRTSGLTRHAGGLSPSDDHEASIYFRPFFPSVPIEVSLAQPVFHPNVHPESGFVCLWNRFSVEDTVFETIAQLQRVVTWQLFNDASVHVMQPDALGWLRTSSSAVWPLPLPCTSIVTPPDIQMARTWCASPAPNRRQRLERFPIALV